MITSKAEFEAQLVEVELSFNEYIERPSEKNEKHYLTIKNKYRQEVLESDIDLILKWSKD
jgi:hypothetical protein